MSTHKKKKHSGCCCSSMGRRDFLAGMGALGGSALALRLGLFDAAVANAMGAPPRAGAANPARLHAGFTRQPVDEYWMGWPGAAYDIPASQQRYTDILGQAADKLGVSMDVEGDALVDDATVDAFAARVKDANSDGVILTVMGLHPDGWSQVSRFLEQRGDIPVIVYAPQGTQFTPVLQPYRDMPGVFVGATQDVEWLATATNMLAAIHRMAHTRIAVIHGEEESEDVLDPLGATLQRIPLEAFALLYDATENSADAREIAAAYQQQAKGIVEPNETDILEAARTYVANRQIMEQYNCHAVTMDCLGLVASRRCPPPCMAYMQLLNEGTCGACEADVTGTLSLLLSSYLLQRPAFLHNPSPNTVNNTYMGAHCTAPTKMDGFDAPDSEYILRSHHESDVGVAPQVLLREGQGVTMMKFIHAGELMACTGNIIHNIETTPHDGVGGCRTAFEMSVDDVRNTLDIRGHHNVLVYGKHLPMLKAYCQLSKIDISRIDGAEV